MKLWIKNGTLIDVDAKKFCPSTDVLCEDGRIVTIGSNLDLKNFDGIVIDAKGLWISPGLIDMHAQLRDPGFPEEETLHSAIEAAKAGGYTGVVCTPNTDPVLDCGSVLQYVILKSEKEGFPIYPLGALTQKNEGEQISEMGDLLENGAVGFADTTHPTMRTDILRCALEYAKTLGRVVCLDCEDTFLAEDGMMHEGYQSTVLGLKGIPSEAEYMIVARNIALASLTGAAIHIQMVSTKESVELIAAAKAKGLLVTAETSASYFALNCESMDAFNTSMKLRPPLRTREDMVAIRQAVEEGVIDVIVSAHAPQLREETHLEYELAPKGAVGLETSVGVTLNEWVHYEEETIARIVAAMSLCPAQILGLKDKGLVKEGFAADITLIDSEKEWVVDSTIFRSLSMNTPFEGKSLKGKVVATILNGRVVYEDYS